VTRDVLIQVLLAAIRAQEDEVYLDAERWGAPEIVLVDGDLNLGTVADAVLAALAEEK
jgi:hypothetical protein